MSELTGPRQVILVSSRARPEIMGKEIERDNIITLAWHMPVSFEPQLYAIAIGKTRFSCKMIQESKAFVVNFIPKELEKQAMFCGTNSGLHIDKFQKTRLTMEESETIDCPRIKEAIAYMECEVVDEIEAGDHMIFIGKVKNSNSKGIVNRLFQGNNKEFTTTES
ncbi:MAG: flavin reductase family protein [Nanoarchaeota archaeon]